MLLIDRRVDNGLQYVWFPIVDFICQCQIANRVIGESIIDDFHDALSEVIDDDGLHLFDPRLMINDLRPERCVFDVVDHDKETGLYSINGWKHSPCRR